MKALEFIMVASQNLRFRHVPPPIMQQVLEYITLAAMYGNKWVHQNSLSFVHALTKLKQCSGNKQWKNHVADLDKSIDDLLSIWEES